MPSLAFDNVAGSMSEKVADAVSTGRDFVRDVAHNVVEGAPDAPSAVGRAAQSSIDTLADVAVEIPGQVAKVAARLVALAPFIDQQPARRIPRWVLGAAAVVAVAGLVWWLAGRRTDHRVETVVQRPDAPEAGVDDRRRAAAAR